MNKKRLAILSISLVLCIIIIDQVIKVVVKTNMHLYEHIRVTDWFYIAFTENRGMAFGMQLFKDTPFENVGKMGLTIFRIIAAFFIIYYIRQQIRKGASTGYIVLLSMVLAGDIGNVIDCMFYGQVFSESLPYPSSAPSTFVPFGEGYDAFMMGRVVDMFYFPLVEWNMPYIPLLSWIPGFPAVGEHCVFFNAIFNFADASISVSMILLILFYRKHIMEIGKKDDEVPLSQTSSSTE
ncbi:MAG: lipoprotein signal peptidase [Bacteroidaceae bacterium]|nr:lipoprotein signal peptidase [Bacteroidaceae bacterium]